MGMQIFNTATMIPNVCGVMRLSKPTASDVGHLGLTNARRGAAAIPNRPVAGFHDGLG